MLDLRLKISQWFRVYKCMKKRKTFINFRFSGEDQGGQNNKVLGTLKNNNRVFLLIDPSQFDHIFLNNLSL